MRKKNAPTKRQLDLIDDLFAGELDEAAVLEKHDVTARIYGRWQADDAFIEHLEKRIAAAHRSSAALIARYAPVAAAKLIQLTQSDKEEVARRACLDVISMQKPQPKAAPPDAAEPRPAGQFPPLSDHAASRILEILAEDSQQADPD